MSTKHRLRYLVGSALLYSSITHAVTSSWNLNDVSILFGLPQGGANASLALPAPEDRGQHGQLLPSDAYALLPTLYQPGKGNPSLYEQALRVTAFRYDPCPQPATDGCSAELRLVWQPVEFDMNKHLWVARDAALHSTHDLSVADAELLRMELWRMKRRFEERGVTTNRLPLGIHPASLNPQTAEDFLIRMRTLLLRHAGADNLRRVTFTALRVPKKWWRFGAIERDASGRWQRMDIPRLDAQLVDIFNVAVADGIGLGAERGVDAIFNVLPDEYPEADNIFALINKGYRFNDQRDLAVFREKLGAVARFRNPHRTNAENLDCTSCHYADAARRYAESRFPRLAGISPADAFDNPDPASFDLHNTSPLSGDGRVVRAFGFHGADAAVSQRTINESAVVAHWLNKRRSLSQARAAGPARPLPDEPWQSSHGADPEVTAEEGDYRLSMTNSNPARY